MRISINKPLLLGLVTALTVVVASCGKDQKYVGIAGEANRICQREHAGVKFGFSTDEGLEEGRNMIAEWKAWGEFSSKDKQQAVEQIDALDLEHTVLLKKVLDRSLPELKELTPPDKDADIYSEYLAIRESSLNILNKAVKYVEGGRSRDSRGEAQLTGYQYTQLMSEFAMLDLQADKLARQIRLSECGKDVEQLLIEKFGLPDRAS